MTDFTGIFERMLTMMLTMFIGFAAAKMGYLDQHTKSKISKLLLNITLPCMIISSVNDLNPQGGEKQIAIAFILAALQFFLLLLAGWCSNLVLRTPHQQRSVYLFMSCNTNTGFIGIPMVLAVFGKQSILITSIYIMVLSVFIFTVGVNLLQPAQRLDKQRVKDGIRSAMNLCTFGSLTAMALFVFRIELPVVIKETLSYVGSITSPMAMLLMGVALVGVPVKEILKEWRLYPFILIRQLLFPALCYVILKSVLTDQLLIGSFALLFALPTATMTPIFVENAGQNVNLAAKGTVLSTLSSFLLLPLITVILVL